jgi:hypothetical protein
MMTTAMKTTAMKTTAEKIAAATPIRRYNCNRDGIGSIGYSAGKSSHISYDAG